jgi:hypothetical protein
MVRNIDIVDIITKLNKKFPYVEFIVKEEIRSYNRSFYRFFLKKLLSQTFEPPIKTSISFLKDDYIDDHEFYQLELKMYESFNLEKLLIK